MDPVQAGALMEWALGQEVDAAASHLFLESSGSAQCGSLDLSRPDVTTLQEAVCVCVCACAHVRAGVGLACAMGEGVIPPCSVSKEPSRLLLPS